MDLMFCLFPLLIRQGLSSQVPKVPLSKNYIFSKDLLLQKKEKANTGCFVITRSWSVNRQGHLREGLMYILCRHPFCSEARCSL